MASTVAIWNRQGVYTQKDDYFYDADFHHPGVFLLYVEDTIDIESFLDDFQYIQPAGTKWYIRYVLSVASDSIELLNYSLPVIMLEAGTNRGWNIYTDEFNFFDFVPQPAPIPIAAAYSPYGEVGIADSALILDSMTFMIDDERITLDMMYVSAALNSEQPGIELDIPN
jgi:hypothetical protein